MGVDSDEGAERDLGVVEAITQVTRSCPSGAVVAAAEQALEAIKQGGPEVLRPQAYFVLTAIKGWRGERARQVHRSLSRFLETPPRAAAGSAEVASPASASPSASPAPDPSPPRTRS